MCKINVRLSEGELKQILTKKLHLTLQEKLKEKLKKIKQVKKAKEAQEYYLKGNN